MKSVLKSLVLFIILFSHIGYADTVEFIDIKPACEDIRKRQESYVFEENCNCDQKELSDYLLTSVKVSSNEEQPSTAPVVIDESDLNKLCEQFKGSNEGENGLVGMSFDPPDKKKKWRVVLTFGPFLAFHHKMDLHIQNGDTNATIRGLKPIQRTSLHHYNIFSGRTKPGQFIDEPQNRITLELVNDKWFMGLEYNHPKILFQDQYSTPENNQSVDIEGVIANEPVNVQGVPLNQYIYQIQASHGNTNINAFGGKNFTLSDSPKGNNLELQLGAGAGVSFANGVSKYFYTDDNGDRKLRINEHQGMKIYGFNVAGKFRLRHNFLKGRMNATLSYDGIYTRIDGPLGDFKVKGNLYSHQIGFAVGVRVDDLFKKKRKKKSKK